MFVSDTENLTVAYVLYPVHDNFGIFNFAVRVITSNGAIEEINWILVSIDTNLFKRSEFSSY